jgi:hypothetical protein
MKVDNVNKIVYVRQSWLNDMAICAERARLGIVRPEFRTGSDATIIGTAIHAGIESVLDGRSPDIDGMLEVVNNEYETLETTNYKKTNIDEAKIPEYLEAMSLAFYNDILPQVELGGKVEHYFKVPLGITVQDYAVWLEGTMDYIAPSGLIWDWKTSSRAYYIKDKQKSAIQPTVYGYAAQYEGLASGPVTNFNYGVMVRNSPSKSQIASVTRTQGHYDWLKYFVRGAVGSCLKVGTDSEWFMNDSSTLCSSSWCSYWSICKGAFNTND